MKALTVEKLSVGYGGRLVVEEAGFHLPAGGALGLVGESGSGKSTLARAVCGLVPRAAGRVLIDGAAAPRGRGPRPVQLVFQNPGASLNPKRSIRLAIAEACEGRLPGRRERDDAVAHYLGLVGLDPGLADRLPGQLSGGQKQRVAIARALAAEPAVLVADEITSALDLSVQAAILNLMAELRARLGLTLLFISHNLGAVRYLCDDVAVMLAGRIVEQGPARQVIETPSHDYTRCLVAAVPSVTDPTDRNIRQ